MREDAAPRVREAVTAGSIPESLGRGCLACCLPSALPLQTLTSLALRTKTCAWSFPFARSLYERHLGQGPMWVVISTQVAAETRDGLQ